MLKETLRACHKKDIAVPAYVSVEWDVYAGQTHPEWCIVSPESKVPGPRLDPIPGCCWPTLCVLGGYRKYLADTVKELVSNYDMDGVFFDIVEDLDNCNETALAQMRKEGVDINDKTARMAFQRRVMIDFMREFYELIQKIRRGTPVFYNGRIQRADARVAALPDPPGGRVAAVGLLGLRSLPADRPARAHAGQAVPGHDRAVPQELGGFRDAEESGGARIRMPDGGGPRRRMLDRRPDASARGRWSRPRTRSSGTSTRRCAISNRGRRRRRR